MEGGVRQVHGDGAGVIPPAWFTDADRAACSAVESLIAAGEFDGTVLHADIRDIRSDDIPLGGRRHFFAGVGCWEYALQLAGWPAGREVWTGSCPCQPFSDAGKRRATADDRHVWPLWFSLIRERRPSAIFGEQVASDLGYEWLAGVRADLEAAGYAVGTADLPAGGVGAPQRRQRLFWYACLAGAGGAGSVRAAIGTDQIPVSAGDRAARAVAGTEGGRLRRGAICDQAVSEAGDSGPQKPFGQRCIRAASDAWRASAVVRCTEPDGRVYWRRVPAESVVCRVADGLAVPLDDDDPRRGYPLTTAKIAGRTTALRLIGNAIVPQVAAAFVRAAMGA